MPPTTLPGVTETFSEKGELSKAAGQAGRGKGEEILWARGRADFRAQCGCTGMSGQAIRKVRQEDLKCKASLGYKTGPSQNTNQTKPMKRL